MTIQPKAVLFFVFFLLFRFSLIAQKTAIYSNHIIDYKTGLELFEKQKYGSAQKIFLKTIESIGDPNSAVAINAEYYAALCALELFNSDAEYLLARFIEAHPGNHNIGIAYFQMGKYKFRKKNYKQAIEWFQKVDIYNLGNEELSEYYFKLGYSCFVLEDYEKARQMFFEIKDTDIKYSVPATYYYAHISYLNKNYETALQSFITLSQSGSFAHVVPYYIAQIYHLQGKYEALLKYAPPLLDSANTKRAPEIARLIGEAYYNTSRFAEAIPFLKRYMEQAYKIEREDFYQLGYAYYKSGEYNNAVRYFKQVVDKQDELAQNAWYHLGDCYLKNDEKKFARLAFRAASKFEPPTGGELLEDAAYNYAKLSYQLMLNPIYALKNYIDKYPNANAQRIDELYEYLVKVYLNTRNYNQALKSLEQIKAKSDKLLSAYQRIAYYRGVELFNDKKLHQAIEHFDKSLTYAGDGVIAAFCHFWKGEAFYRLGKSDAAIESYQKFIFSPDAINTPVFNGVNYNLGYTYFMKKEYANAITWFRKYVRDVAGEDSAKINDAWLRIGDSYFITKDYLSAIDYYENAIALKMTDNDYALFQKALAKGVLGKQNEKVSVLLTLLEKHPKSGYADDAGYELGKSYTLLNKSDSALIYYNSIVSQYPKSSYVKKALLNTGLVYYNKDENTVALNTFKQVINDYPATQEANEALGGIKNIYVEMGDVNTYTDYVATLSFANITKQSLDSTTYEAAQLRYMRGDCEKAVVDFDNYLQKYPDGFFVLNANFYKAECNYKANNYQDALSGYHEVLKKPKNTFSEKAILRSAAIHFNLGNYSDALENYFVLEEVAEYKNNIIEARIGQMHCNFLLKKYDVAIQEAHRLIETEKVSNEIINEAHFTIARSALETDNYNLALAEFQITAQSTRSEMGAEAQYYVAYIQYLRSEHKASEKTIFELNDRVPSYDYWIAKGFILLADNYVQTDNAFQAKATLKSVIDNNDNPELLKLAQDKLDKILEVEALAKREQIEEKVEIQFEDYNINYDKLFDDFENE